MKTRDVSTGFFFIIIILIAVPHKQNDSVKAFQRVFQKILQKRDKAVNLENDSGWLILVCDLWGALWDSISHFVNKEKNAAQIYSHLALGL